MVGANFNSLLARVELDRQPQPVGIVRFAHARVPAAQANQAAGLG